MSKKGKEEILADMILTIEYYPVREYRPPYRYLGYG